MGIHFEDTQNLQDNNCRYQHHRIGDGGLEQKLLGECPFIISCPRTNHILKKGHVRIENGYKTRVDLFFDGNKVLKIIGPENLAKIEIFKIIKYY